jgi:hypothetical protein
MLPIHTKGQALPVLKIDSVAAGYKTYHAKKAPKIA